jgi:DNA-binding MarR family transcriptional regulator
MPDQQSLRAWRLFLEAHARVTAQLEEDLLQTGGLPLSWYDVLVQLSEAPDGRLRMHELARRVLLSKSGLTRLVDRLCAAGYLGREPDPDDGRGTLAVLLPAGRQALRASAGVHLRGVERSFTSVLLPAERDALIAAFSRILDRLGDTSDS